MHGLTGQNSSKNLSAVAGQNFFGGGQFGRANDERANEINGVRGCSP